MRSGRKLSAWLAILAMALQAFWPLIAQAKPQWSVMVPVCTVGGVTHYVELPLGETPLEKQSTAQHEHCKLCVFGAERVAALPAAHVPPIVVEFRSPGQFLHFAEAVPPSGSHPPAQPRAPPVLS